MQSYTSVNKLGSGTDLDPYRPDTKAKVWRLITETETTMTIEILN